MKFLIQLLVLCLLAGLELKAHPMPNSILQLDIKANWVAAELKWPLKELQLAFPNEDIDMNANTLLVRKASWLDDYLHAHMHIVDSLGNAWKISITGKKIETTEQSFTGKFHELVFMLWLQPPPGVSPRHFTMNYDAIMHQVVTHKMLISIRQDWDGGLSAKENADADLGMLVLDQGTNKVPPLIVNLDEGSRWKGFKNMVSLGIAHISEGSDHLLFLLVLMLPASLIASRKRWTKSGGTRYSAIRLLKIATAFTIGHSLTLLAGAVGWLWLPSQPVELLISLSIFIGAVHALRPVFPGKEIFVAAGFGLVHGLAFAATIANLNLDAGRMALSILGFNLGIELMQLFVILLVVPWLIILSQYKIYGWVRIVGAAFALLASVSWIVSRVSNHSNKIADLAQSIMEQGKWIVLGLVLLAIVSTFLFKKQSAEPLPVEG